jgi:sugar transferase (PEP-CTERM/EpsH1 system associated)
MGIRILHVVDSLSKGGLENGLVNLIERLPATRFEHIICAVRCLGPNAERLPRDRVRIVCLEKEATGSRVQFPALVRTIREFQPDIVHSRNWGAIEAVLAGQWVSRCALIHSEHGVLADTLGGEPWRRRCFRRLAYELADQVISVSYQLRDLQAQRSGFAAAKIAVIHNGVDTVRFSPDAAARGRVRAELDLAEDEFCIGCVANLSPVKDHMTLLAAVKEIAESCRPWRLLLIGEGPERPRLESFVNSHPAWKSQVQFLGLSHRVAEWLRAMDMFVLPSVSEGISNSLLEAMATGLPVAATAAGGNPEVVIDGQSGLLFPVGGVRQLAELLLRLRSNAERRAELAQAARRRAQASFSLETMVAHYAELYAGVAPRLPWRKPIAAEV